jgi:hypothetical protein
MTANTLPANISNMATGLAQAAQAATSGAGVGFLKMLKGTGVFVYGQEEVEVEPTATWAINPASFQHGWIAWGDKAHGTAGKKLGEHMGSAAELIYPQGDLVNVEGSWSQQVGFDLRCTSGEDEGLQLRYLTNSFGGRKAWSAILSAVVEHIQSGSAEVVPLVRLNSTSYKHPEYGTTYNPEFIVTDWVDMDAAPAEKKEEAAPKADKPKKKKKGKKGKKAAEPEALEGELEPEVKEETPEPAPRRRRRKAAA